MRPGLEFAAEPGSDDANEPRARAPSHRARRVLLALFGRASSAALRLLGATWRLEILGADPRRPSSSSQAPRPPHLAALLHASLVAAAWLFRDSGYCVAVSRSRDGSLVAATLRALGYAEPARGSSSRGGTAALMSLFRRLEDGTTVAVLVDGPRGPAGIAKPGVAALSRLSTTPIQPIAVAARPALRLRSWDRTLLPLPFARVVCAYGEPLAPPASPDEDAEQATTRAIEGRLAALEHQAAVHLARRSRSR